MVSLKEGNMNNKATTIFNSKLGPSEYIVDVEKLKSNNSCVGLFEEEHRSI